jgi:TPR repeat protein
MSADEPRPQPSRRAARTVKKKALPTGPAQDLRDAIYRLYAEADRPQLEELAGRIAVDDALPGAPGKDLISKIISGEGLAGQQDTVTVATVLAQAAGREAIAHVAEQVRRLWITAATADPAAADGDRLGRPIGDCDPLVLEVHPAIQVAGDTTAGTLPGYVPRAHDMRLREVAGELAAGQSQWVTLVGGSSTGKTRACWELVRTLDLEQPGRWWIWHPYDPTRPQAVLADLDRVGPGTVIWLNEAQFYLQPPNIELGEQIAARLRTLLHDPQRGPVLVLATLWPHYWDQLTFRPQPKEPDPYAQARDLLTGSRISVADGFTANELAELSSRGVDPRLREAVAHAEGGRVTQYLAGAPELQDRYDTAPPAARALVQVAIDARRLGHPVALPHSLLEQAAPGYLDDHDWDTLTEDWLEEALAYTARPCKGARGPLTRIRTRPGEQSPAVEQPCYRLADYLEQSGRTERAGVYPPNGLWRAFAAAITDPVLLRHLGQQAQDRGRYQHAIWLYLPAADRGNVTALQDLALMHENAGDTAGAMSLAVQAADRGSTEALWRLGLMRETVGDVTGAVALYQQAADRGNTTAVWHLAEMRQDAGETADAEALYQQAADRGSTESLRRIALMREKLGDTAGAVAMAVQAADRGSTEGLRHLAVMREYAGDPAAAEDLYRQAADRGDTEALCELAWKREQAEDPAGAEALYRQAADRGDNRALRELAWMREHAGDLAGAKAAYRQAADRGDTEALRQLARMRQQTGDAPAAEAPAEQAVGRIESQAMRNPTEAGLGVGDAAGVQAVYRQAVEQGNMIALGLLATMLEGSGDSAGGEALYRLAADRGHTDALRELARTRERAGDTADAEVLYRQAADRGDTEALWELARMRQRTGDITGAEAAYHQAADHGAPSALEELAEMRKRTGDAAGADRILRFGLTGSGEIANGLNFSV